MKYFIRSLKYFVALCVICVAILALMLATGTSALTLDQTVYVMFHTSRYATLFAAIVVLAALYPKFGFVVRKVEGDVEENREQIINAYDNTILYTDHVLAQLTRLLEENASRRASALLYVSDHGESTGESGLYLHGAPYLFAPKEQTRVPMLLWTSRSFQDWRGLDTACTATRASAPLSHDHFFHTVLGLLDLQTAAYRPELDALAGCAPA